MTRLRNELWAYTKHDSCRLAAILVDFLPDVTAGVERDQVKAVWARHYPLHQKMTGKKNIASRVGNGLNYLKQAGIVRAQGTKIVVRNVAWLKMAADNLEIIQDAQGRTINPTHWRRLPAVPPHLKATQRPSSRNTRRSQARTDRSSRLRGVFAPQSRVEHNSKHNPSEKHAWTDVIVARQLLRL